MRMARDLVQRETRVTTPPLCPELRLHLVTPETRLWRAPQAEVDALGVGLPFWAFCWPGGQALARYVLDHPHVVAGRSVLDLGAGCGVVALAAARVGARTVTASEIDPCALAAVELNAELQGVSVALLLEDVLHRASGAWEVILAADVCYDRDDAARLRHWLQARAQEGTQVLLSDPARGFLRTEGLVEVARLQVPTHPELEGAAVRETVVFSLLPQR
ncbi:MAG: 50S ribosomal protein L11 methyltransferase [Myxococcota bacterium]